MSQGGLIAVIVGVGAGLVLALAPLLIEWLSPSRPIEMGGRGGPPPRWRSSSPRRSPPRWRPRSPRRSPPRRATIREIEDDEDEKWTKKPSRTRAIEGPSESSVAIRRNVVAASHDSDDDSTPAVSDATTRNASDPGPSSRNDAASSNVERWVNDNLQQLDIADAEDEMATGDSIDTPEAKIADEIETASTLGSDISIISSTSRRCMFCTDRKADSAFYRCGHKIACHSCAIEQWKGAGTGKCPVCNQAIIDVIKIY